MAFSERPARAWADPLLFVVAVVCVGTAASLFLANSSGSSAPQQLFGPNGPANGGGLSVALPNVLWAVLVLVPLSALLVVLTRRWRPSSSVPALDDPELDARFGRPRGRTTKFGPIVAIAVALLLVLLVVLALNPWSGQGVLQWSPTGSTNQNDPGPHPGPTPPPPPPGTNGTGAGNSSGSTNGSGNGTSGGSSGNGTANGTGSGGGTVGTGGSNGGTQSGNGTGGSGPVGTGNGAGHTPPGRTLATPVSFYLPWSLTVWGVIGAALVLAPLAVWAATRKPTPRGGAPPSPWRDGALEAAKSALDREALHGALASALASADRGDDPRETIVRLYTTLLGVLGPRLGDVSASTPEEIRIAHLVRLGLDERASQTLTRLFEAARYSRHAIDAPAASLFRETVRAAEATVLRSPASA